MFDYHLHSSVSYDSQCDAKKMLKSAEDKGLKEICFTDHYDFNDDINKQEDIDKQHDIFDIEKYKESYNKLYSDKVIVRRGVEFGLTHWNQTELKNLLSQYAFDYVIGSVHCVGGYDPYFKEFWTHNGINEGFEKYLLQTLKCVKLHNDFDALGHINYVCRSVYNTTKKPLRYNDYFDLCDEIMKVLAENGKGMEINTSGVDRVGEFLPSCDYIKRFKELGGEIITVGSDSHDDIRVGQYINEALEVAKNVFGYVNTFENRKARYIKL